MRMLHSLPNNERECPRGATNDIKMTYHSAFSSNLKSDFFSSKDFKMKMLLSLQDNWHLSLSSCMRFRRLQVQTWRLGFVFFYSYARVLVIRIIQLSTSVDYVV